MRRRLLVAAVALLTLTPSACDALGYEQGEVLEVEQELNERELTIWDDGEEVDVDVTNRSDCEVGDVYPDCDRDNPDNRDRD